MTAANGSVLLTYRGCSSSRYTSDESVDSGNQEVSREVETAMRYPLAAIFLASAPQRVSADDDVVGEQIEIVDRAPEETQPTEYRLSAAEIQTLPGAMNDALRAVTALPAAARIPYSFGGLVLRGMSPRDTKVFIDGVEIPIAFHFGGISAVFPTGLLDSLEVVPSGFDVSVGRAEGGVVELTSRKPRGDRWRVGGEASLLHSAVTLEGPTWGDGAFLFGLRRSYLDVLATPFVDRNDVLPSYLDGQLRGVWGTPARGQLAVYVLGSLDRLANSDDAAVANDPYADGHVAANFGFLRLGSEYKRRDDRTTWTLAPFVGTNVLSVYERDYNGGPMLTEQQLSRRWYQFGGRLTWLRDIDHGFLRAGVDVAGGYLGRVTSDVIADDAIDADLPLPRNTVLWTNAAVWAEVRRQWYGDRISLRPGIRVERFGLGRELVVDPRINAHVRLDDHTTLRGAVGRYHQPPSPAHFDEFLDNLNAKSSYVDQTSLGIEWSPEPAITASAVGFFNDGRRTLVDIPGKSRDEPPINLDLIFRELVEDQLGLYGYQDNVGRERSYGVELAMGYASTRLRLLANFTWSRALRRYADPMAGWQPYGLDQPLRLNVLCGVRLGKWNIGARVTAASGNPVNLHPSGSPIDPTSDDPGPLVRLPTFWQVDVRFDRELRHNLRLFFDIQNVTNHANVELRSNVLDEQDPSRWAHSDERGLPIVPLVGLELVPDA